STINSFWPRGLSENPSRMTLRIEFDLPFAGEVSVTNVRVLLSIDNDAVVTFNGTTVQSITHEQCPVLDEFEVAIPDRLLGENPNKLEIEVADRGVESYVDLRVLADVH